MSRITGQPVSRASARHSRICRPSCPSASAGLTSAKTRSPGTGLKSGRYGLAVQDVALRLVLPAELQVVEEHRLPGFHATVHACKPATRVPQTTNLPGDFRRWHPGLSRAPDPAAPAS
jgi:hypothetical protein